MLERSWLKPDNGDVIIVVNVKTRQNEDKFEFDQEQLIVKITAPPLRGKANKKLIRLLRKKFQTEVILEAGQKSSTKVFRLKNSTLKQILSFLEKELTSI